VNGRLYGGIVADADVLECERRNHDGAERHHNVRRHRHRCDRRGRDEAGKHRNRRPRYTLDDPLGGQGAEECADPRNTEHGGVSGGLDGESSIDNERDADEADTKQKLAGSTGDDRETHFVVSQLRRRRTPVSFTTADSPAAERRTDTAIKPRRGEVQDDGCKKCRPHVKKLECTGSNNTQEPGHHAEQQRQRVGCDELLRHYETRNHRGTSRIQNAGRQQECSKRQVSHDWRSGKRSNNGSDCQCGAQTLTDDEKGLT
jgi:hypothetical protein